VYHAERRSDSRRRRWPDGSATRSRPPIIEGEGADLQRGPFIRLRRHWVVTEACEVRVHAWSPAWTVTWACRPQCSRTSWTQTAERPHPRGMLALPHQFLSA